MADSKKTGGPGVKERKRTNPDDDKVTVSKVLCDNNKNSSSDIASVPSIALRSLVPGASTELVERARALVEKAVKQHKVFIIFGQYSSVRRALKRRGWLEKPCDCGRVPRYSSV